MLNLSVFLEDSARKHPQRVALVLGDTRLTYAEVDDAANQVANLLVSRGIRRGDKVALSCPNLPFFPIVYYGILKAGAVVVPLNVLFKPREIAYHLGGREPGVAEHERHPLRELAGAVLEADGEVEHGRPPAVRK
jgi:long-chain acyl-CoA synthetase